MTVRRAVRDDWPAIIEMMRACHAASNYTEPFCDMSAARMLEAAETDHAACFVNEDATGFLFLALTPLHFNHSAISANELGFWGRDGRALIAAGRVWAKNAGAGRLVMGSEDQIRGPAMARFYRMQGLKPFANNYEVRL